MRFQLLIAVLVGTLIMPPVLNCSDFQYTVTVGAGEEYNTNVNEKSTPRADWVSVGTAKGGATYEAPRLKAEGKIDGSFNVYALGNRTDEFKGSGQAKASVAVMPEVLFVEGEEQFKQVFTNLARGETNPTDSTRDQSNQNTLIGRIYLTPHLSDRLALKAGTEFTAYIYDSSVQNKQQYTAFANTMYELTPSLQFLLDLLAQRQETKLGGYERASARAGFKWNYMDGGSIMLSGGPRYSRYDNGATNLDPDIEAKLDQTLGRLLFTGAASSKYVENPSSIYSSRTNVVSGSVAWKHDRGSFTARAGYTLLDGEDTKRSNQLSLGLAAEYQITSRLLLKASGARETSLTSTNFQTRWYAEGNLAYELGHNFSLEGYSKWKLSNTTLGTNSNYTVNIAGIRLTKTF